MTAEYLRVAMEAAKAAGEIINRHYSTNLRVEYKEDRTPVTVADKEAERAIVDTLLKEFPDHGFWGEETGKGNSDSDYLWLIDPLDGTKNFIRHNPVVSTQIALTYKQEFALGVSYASVVGELAYAEKGSGAYLNGKRLRVGTVTGLNEATLSLGNIKTLARTEQWQNLGRLIGAVNRVRGYGDFLHYHFLAAGKIDLIIESDVNVLDIAALVTIVREAGGVFTDLNGDPPTVRTTSVLAASGAELHTAALKALQGIPTDTSTQMHARR